MASMVYTIGHSNRTADDFQALLQGFNIERLADVRTVPRSRHVPHFNADALAQALERVGIDYYPLRGLGGLRKPKKDSINRAWKNAGFRGFADYMQSGEFQTALAELMALAAGKRVALMCAEAVPWRCHRSLIADALVVHGWEVRHILSRTAAQLHQLNPIASVDGPLLSYPRR